MKKLFIFVFVLFAQIVWAQNDKQSLDSTRQILGRPIVTGAKALDVTINSSTPEVNPVLSPDGTTLYFSRKNHPKNSYGVKDPEDIWASRHNGDSWDEAKLLSKPFNGVGPHYICQILPATGKSPYIMILGNDYSKKGKKRPLEYSVSKNGGKSWSGFKSISINKVSGFEDRTESFLTSDRKYLLISMKYKGSQGGKDIFISKATSENKFAEPVNLGVEVNSPGDETSPFMSEDHKMLFFSSNGREDSYGEHDIYVSVRLNEDSWDEWAIPENLGSGINTPYEEQDFEMEADGKTVYFSRGTSEEDSDIYEAQLAFGPNTVQVKGKMLDQSTGLPLAGRVVVERASDGQWVAMVDTNPATGEYLVQVPTGVNYEIYGVSGERHSTKATLDLGNNDKANIAGPDILFKSQEIVADKTPTTPATTTETPVQTTEPVRETPTTTETTSTPVALPDGQSVQFASGRARVQNEYYELLDQLVGMLNQQPNMKVQVAGHADKTGNDNRNMTLSKLRAQSVAKYLRSKGIKRNQIEIAYFGSANPLDPSETDDAYRLNRRVELKVVEGTGSSSSGEETAVASGNVVRFGFDKTNIPDAFTAVLSNAVQQLQASPTATVDLNGYTDRIGPDTYNLDLSRRRAEAVAEYLKSQGIAPERIRVNSFGSQNPVDERKNRLNRRVEIVINQ